MTLDHLFDRDRRIDALDRKGDARSVAETDEFYSLVFARKAFDRRIGHKLAGARRKVAELERYAAQHRLLIGAAA